LINISFLHHTTYLLLPGVGLNKFWISYSFTLNQLESSGHVRSV